MPISPKRKSAVNVRRSDVMEQVAGDIRRHYQSPLIEAVREHGNELHLENMTLRLAREFGFCNGVRRAIDIAYAARRVFPEQRIFLIGEIIHNPEVNRQLDEMGLLRLPWTEMDASYDELHEGDVVIIPAFGVPVNFRTALEDKGVSIVDTTCGDVVKVWRRVKEYAQAGITSIIHGKANHEESIATASHALGQEGNGHFLIVFSRQDVEILCNYILGQGDKDAFMHHFRHAVSPGFDPDVHLHSIGMANQTTMLKGETQQFQQLLRASIAHRDGGDTANFHAFDTICGATQDRQSALFELLETPTDAIFVVGGYNSSNTTHLADIATELQPHTYFVSGADCLTDLHRIRCFDRIEKSERCVELPPEASDLQRRWSVGVTAGASCPANLIEEVIRRLAQLRGCFVPENANELKETQNPLRSQLK